MPSAVSRVMASCLLEIAAEQKNSCSYSPVKEQGFKNNQINNGLLVQQSQKL